MRPARPTAFSYSAFSGPLASSSFTVLIHAIQISIFSISALVEGEGLVVVALAVYEPGERREILQADAIVGIGSSAATGDIGQKVLALEFPRNFVV